MIFGTDLKWGRKSRTVCHLCLLSGRPLGSWASVWLVQFEEGQTDAGSRGWARQGWELLAAGVSAFFGGGVSPSLLLSKKGFGNRAVGGRRAVSAKKVDAFSRAVPASSCPLLPSVASVASLDGLQLWSC